MSNELIEKYIGEAVKKRKPFKQLGSPKTIEELESNIKDNLMETEIVMDDIKDDWLVFGNRLKSAVGNIQKLKKLDVEVEKFVLLLPQ